jgi:sugar phosphate isomerase/epimerase
MFALATDYHGTSRNALRVREALAHLAAAGFTHVHWCHEWRGGYIYSIHEMRQIKAWFDELGLKAKGVHASSGEIRSHYKTMAAYAKERENLKDYVSENEYNRLAGVELIKNRIDLAAVLGAGEIVLHLHFPFRIFALDEGFKARFISQVFKSFDECRDYCLEKGIKICIENLPDSPEEAQMELLDRLFERYGPEFMGLCFDTGHGNITSKDGLAFAKRYTERLFIAHIHDNHGAVTPEYCECIPLIKASDEHLIPFEGTVNWEGFAEVLAGSPYKPPYLMEVTMRSSENEEEFFKKAMKAGKRLQAMVDTYKMAAERWARTL